MAESTTHWKTEGYVYDKTTLVEFVKESNSFKYNIPNKKFVFATQWQFLPDKFQTGKEPLISGVIHVKEKPELKSEVVVEVKK